MKSKPSFTLLDDSFHIFTLTSLAVAQPLFDILSRQAEFFAARNSEPIDMFLFSATLSLLLPGALVLLRTIIDYFSKPLGRFYHQTVMTTLFGIFILILLKTRHPLPSYAAIVLTLALSSLLTITYRHSNNFRRLLTYLVPAPLLFLLVFLFSPNIRLLTFSSDQMLTSDGKKIREVPVVMVVFDELPVGALMNPDGQIDGANFPNFKRLADASIWFRNATTVAPVTNYAVPAILSGLYPDERRLCIDAAYPQNLFTVLAGSHDVDAYESFTRLCPRSLNRADRLRLPLPSRLVSLAQDTSVLYLHIVLPESLSGELPPLGHQWGNFLGSSEVETPQSNEEATLEEVRNEMAKNRQAVIKGFIDNIRPVGSSRSAFYFLHVLMPHSPWRYYPSGKVYSEEKVLQTTGLSTKMDFWGDDDWLVAQAYQRYLLQLRMVDMMIGRLIDHLKTDNLYDRTLLIVTADHGVSFRVGEAYRKFSETTSGDIMPVPLFMKLPRRHDDDGDRDGRIDDRNVELIDVFPTVAALLSVDLELPTHGHSLLTEDGDSNGWERSEKVMYDFFEFYEKKSHVYPAHPNILAQNIERKKQIFPDPSERSFYLMGEHADLMGREAISLHTGAAAAVVSIDQRALFDDVDTAGRFLPGLVTGRVRGPAASTGDDLWLALSLNGVVAATTRTYRLRNNLRFQALLPEDHFTPGRNTLEVYLIQGLKGEYRLKRLRPLRANGCSLQTGDTSEELITFSNGETLQVTPGAIVGFVDRVETVGLVTKLSGWAITEDHSQVADSIIVTINGECVFSGLHSGNFRPDIERHYNLPQAGYEVSVPAAKMPEAGSLGVRVFGVSRNHQASELNYQAALGLRKPASKAQPATDTSSKQSALGSDCSLRVGQDGRELIVVGNHETLPIMINVVRGFVDHVEILDETVKFSGWALESEKKSIADALIVTINGECAFYGPPSRTYRVDMERHHGLPQAGYELSISADRFTGEEDLTVRVFGVSRNRQVSELAYHDGYRWRRARR